VGDAPKAAFVRDLGANHVILHRDRDVAAEVRRITGGAGVPVAYDSVGKATFEGTLSSLMLRSGHVRVEIGQTFALAEVTRAHEALESRGATGSTLLIPCIQ
jgi:NADPH:quinone reductase-like Zn-dependent oxidoreductase